MPIHPASGFFLAGCCCGSCCCCCCCDGRPVVEDEERSIRPGDDGARTELRRRPCSLWLWLLLPVVPVPAVIDVVGSVFPFLFNKKFNPRPTPANRPPPPCCCDAVRLLVSVSPSSWSIPLNNGSPPFSAAFRAKYCDRRFWTLSKSTSKSNGFEPPPPVVGCGFVVVLLLDAMVWLRCVPIIKKLIKLLFLFYCCGCLLSSFFWGTSFYYEYLLNCRRLLLSVHSSLSTTQARDYL